MTRYLSLAGIALSLGLAACGPGGSSPADGDGNDAAGAGAAVQANAAAAADTALPPCPFRNTGAWKGSNEGGRLLVTGTVDLQMAGMVPALRERAGSSAGTIAFDLALTPEAGAAVTDQVRYEKSGSPRYGSGEIHCGGERIAAFDIVNL